jgi:hypothetical protein
MASTLEAPTAGAGASPIRRPRNWPLWFGAAIVALVVFVAVAGPWLAPRDPMARVAAIDAGERWIGPPYPIFTPGFWLGSDNAGRDLLSRVLWAVRPTMLLVTIIALIRLTLGMAIGLVAGFAGRRWQRGADMAVRAALTPAGAGGGVGGDRLRRHPARAAGLSPRPLSHRLGGECALRRDADAYAQDPKLHRSGAQHGRVSRAPGDLPHPAPLAAAHRHALRLRGERHADDRGSARLSRLLHRRRRLGHGGRLHRARGCRRARTGADARHFLRAAAPAVDDAGRRRCDHDDHPGFYPAGRRAASPA